MTVPSTTTRTVGQGGLDGGSAVVFYLVQVLRPNLVAPSSSSCACVRDAPNRPFHPVLAMRIGGRTPSRHALPAPLH